MRLVFGMVIVLRYFPDGGINFWKKSIAIKGFMHTGKLNGFCKRHRLFVDFAATNHKRPRVVLCFKKCSLEIVNHHDTFGYHKFLLAGNDNVLSVRQRLGEALKSFPPHDDAMSRSKGFKTFEVVAQMPYQRTVLANGVVLTGSDNKC